MTKKGFSIVEIMLAVAIVAVLMAVVLVAVNPGERFASTRDAKRTEEANSLVDAIKKYSVDNVAYPPGVSTSLQMIGTATSGCDVSCGPAIGGASTSGPFTDDDQADFDAGAYSDTQWDGANAWVELTPAGLAAGTGSYRSSTKDATFMDQWETIAWLPQQPFAKELPDNAGAESGYPSGNADMSGNVLLTHLNEESGNISDTSGQGNDGSYNGALYDQAGILNTSTGFDGANDVASFPHIGAYDITGDITMEFFVYGNDWSTWPDIITKGAWTEAYTADIDTAGRVRFGINSDFLVGGTTLGTGQWHHVACVRDGNTRRIYVDGVQDATDTYLLATGTTATPLTYSTNSYPIDGYVDEAAVYNRALSGPEIRARYRRGANKLRFQVRSCDDAACSGEAFIGPDGTAATHYSELDNDTGAPPSFSLTNVPDNRYFQYRARFDSVSGAYSPELKRARIDNQGQGGGASGETAEACIDLSGELVDDYIAEIPYDPETGSPEMTYYAVYLSPGGSLMIRACTPETIDDISVQR